MVPAPVVKHRKHRQAAILLAFKLIHEINARGQRRLIGLVALTAHIVFGALV